MLVYRTYFLCSADGESQPCIRVLDPDLDWDLPCEGGEPQADGSHYTNIHSVVVFKAIQARVGDVRQIR